MVKQIQYLMNPCDCCNFFHKNLYCCFCFWVLQFCFNPLTPAQPVMMSSLLTKVGIIYTQLEDSAGGKDLSNKTQIRVLNLKVPEICTCKKLSEKLGAKFPAITCGYSMVKFVHLDDTFFALQASPLEDQSLQQKEKKKWKTKKKLKNTKA